MAYVGKLPVGAVFDHSPGKTHRGALWVKTGDTSPEGWCIVHPYGKPEQRETARPENWVYRRKRWEE